MVFLLLSFETVCPTSALVSFSLSACHPEISGTFRKKNSARFLLQRCRPLRFKTLEKLPPIPNLRNGSYKRHPTPSFRHGPNTFTDYFQALARLKNQRLKSSDFPLLLPPPCRQTPLLKFRRFMKAVAARNSLLEAVFQQISTLLGILPPDFPAARDGIMLSLPRFGHFPARTMAAGKSALPSGTLLDFLLQDRHSLLEFF